MVEMAAYLWPPKTEPVFTVDAAVKIVWLGAQKFPLKPCPVEDLIDKIESA